MGPALGSARSEKFNSEIANNNTIVYNFNNNFKKFKLTSILENSFFSLNRLISKPVLSIKPNKVIIQLFFYLSLGQKRIVSKSKSLQLQALCTFLSKKFKKPVEFELIRLHYPINESFILAKSIGKLGNKIRRRFKYFVNASFKSAKIDNPNNYKGKLLKSFKHNASSDITGIKMKLGGRLASQRIIPKVTSQIFQEGSLNRNSTSIVNTSRFTNKNRRGSYSITVSMGYKFF